MDITEVSDVLIKLLNQKRRTNMKTLQNNFTTSEQSKRLLKLGVPADSADMYYDQFSGLCFRCEEDYSYNFFDENFKFIPVWSVGRLMEILMICNTYLAPKEFKIEQNSMNPSLIENVVNKIEELEGYNMLDFSKLEG